MRPSRKCSTRWLFASVQSSCTRRITVSIRKSTSEYIVLEDVPYSKLSYAGMWTSLQCLILQLLSWLVSSTINFAISECSKAKYHFRLYHFWHSGALSPCYGSRYRGCHEKQCRISIHGLSRLHCKIKFHAEPVLDGERFSNQLWALTIILFA